MILLLAAILTLVNGLLGFIVNLLPDSPFASLLSGSESILLAVGWLNWVIPVGDMLVIFGAYLAVLLIWAAVDWFLSSFGSVFGGLVGGGS